MESDKETIVFGGGCFWCTEAVFQGLKGVISVVPGYAGGKTENPTYEEVCGGKTGHAETIKIDYVKDTVSLRDLLTVFFATHDPTTLNRQGNDVGAQYRSVILYTTDEQRKETGKFIKEIEASSPNGGKVVTAVEPLKKFHEAETYHKNYYLSNPGNAYCAAVINPKLEKVQKEFANLLKKQ